ncbi:hypothetical protein RND71_041650 [Anisodus tanguticus]|uniref:Uncharacterized protein n=1 Tax=Anisodus tanguticus TaxID=243964 RepID=A0AAE1QW45_9SOLA|nr:hypothetical protein RND71_041650 [Anisodus tanguticus]
MDVWSWICELPGSENWSTGNDSSLIYTLTTSIANPNQSIQFKAEKKLEPNSETHNFSLVFSVCLVGFHDTSQEEVTIWVSDTCHLSSDKPFLPLILQLLQEIISRSPTAHDSCSCPRSQLQKLQPDPVSWILDSHSPESFSSFFNLIFLTRLFWMFAFDAPPAVGSLYFHSLLAPNLEAFSCKHAPVLRTFFISVGTDVELCFMRTFGYMLAKWLILREVGGVGLKSLTPLASHYLGFSYATEAHGLWMLKGYAPVKAMKPTRMNGDKIQFPVIESKEIALKYTLAHQQLEAVIQFEYTVGFYDGFIQVRARLDNIRLGVARLGFNKNEEEEEEDSYLQEKHFPSRIRVWVGPEVGANYVGGLSLGRSSNNVEREFEMQRVLKGNFGNPKQPEVKARAKMATKSKMKNWRWDQEAEGNAAVYEAILYDHVSDCEISTWKPSNGDDKNNQLMNNFRGRYSGGNRAFTKKGGLVFAGEECGEVVWRLSKEMEGSVLKWRVGGQVWLSYWPNNVKSSYYETRLVEWCDEVDLPLIPGKIF